MKKRTKKAKVIKSSNFPTLSPKQLSVYLGIFILTLTGLILLGRFTATKTENYKDTLKKPTLAPQMEVNYPTAKPPEGFIETQEYKIRQYSPNEMFLGDVWKVKYPEELANFSERDLTPISCTKTYWQDYFTKGFQTNEQGGPTYSLTDTKLLSYANTLNSKYSPKHIKLIGTCNTESGKTFVFFGVSIGGGGDYWGKPYIGIDNGAGINEVIENVGSGGCSALQLVRNEFLYVRCSASEGGGGEHMISQVNLNNKSTTRLIYCLTEGDKVNCK